MMAGYTLDDFVPYDRHSWYALFEQYNQQTWPASLCLMVILGVSFWLAASRFPQDNANPAQSTTGTALIRWPILFGLAICWLWIAWQFHARIHLQLNWAAHSWAWGFGIQGIGLGLLALRDLWQRARRPPLMPAWPTASLLLWPVLLPPVIGWWVSDRAVAGLEFAALAPDPTAWLTLLVLILSATRKDWSVVLLMLLPALSLLLSILAAWVIGALDLLILNALAAITCTGVIIYRYKID